MDYHTYLHSFSQEAYCPFCHFTSAEIIEESTYFFVVPARAPYNTDHLLIIPKRHVILLKELKKAEQKELRLLVEQRNTKLQNHHQGVSLLIRDVIAQWGLGKSINHLHFHLIPDCYIGRLNADERTFLSDSDYLQEVQRIQALFT